ncbi:MAG: ATP-binding protein [Candidatus Zixiibacteriota bacterium]
MSRRFRPSSLFWTLAGAFLVVLIAATAAQIYVASSVLHPLAERLHTARTEDLAQDLAAELTSRLTVDSTADVRTVMREVLSDDPGSMIVFRTSAGEIVSAGPQDESRGRFFRSMVDRILDSAIVPLETLPRRALRRARFTPPNPIRIPVFANATQMGEVVAFPPNRPAELRPVLGPWYLFLFLPVALIVAGVGGFVLLRMLLRRLRALEHLAVRVAEGDLDVRLPETGNDEIDRLGAQLNRMTESLHTARQRVEAADQDRRRLFADISHELATPLTSIRGYAETLIQPEVPVSDAERKEFLDNILEESKRMGYLIEDLLELARLEAGAIELCPERLDLAALAANTVRRFEPKFRTAGLQLESSITTDHVWINADGRRIEQMLNNLLVNTLRYVPPGGRVLVTLEPNGLPQDGCHRLSVSDTGPGFSPDALSKVFDRFYRGEPGLQKSGSGLGLAIVKEIVIRHNGRVRADNQPGSGARITVDLPAAEQP